MQTIKLDLQRQSILTPLKAKQNDRYSRFFKVVLLDGSTAFSIPQGAALTVRYIAPSGSGWYDTITEIDNTTKHSAFAISGNEVTVELAEATLTNPGNGMLCLQIYAATGYRIGTWNIPLEIEADPLADSTIAASDYYNVLTGQVAQALGYRDAAANSATAAAASAAEAQQISQQSKGWYATSDALIAAWPTGENGWWAIVGSGDNIWTWDADTTAWVNTHQQTDLSNYYTKTQSDANYAPASSVPLMQGLTATVEPISTASQAYAVGDYFVYSGLLYKCTADIASGGTITPDTNCTATTAGGEITALNEDLATAAATVTAINYAAGSIKLGKSGHIVECQITGVIVNQTLPAGAWYPIGTIPAGFRAVYDVYKTLLASSKQYTLWIATSGVISLMPVSAAGASGDEFYDCFSWIV